MSPGEVLGDLGSRVRRSDDEHPARGDLVWVAVFGAVQLGDVVGESRRNGGSVWPLKVPAVMIT